MTTSRAALRRFVTRTTKQLQDAFEAALLRGDAVAAKRASLELALRTVVLELPGIRQVYRDLLREMLEIISTGAAGSADRRLLAVVTRAQTRLVELLSNAQGRMAERALLRARRSLVDLLDQPALLAAGFPVTRQNIIRPPVGPILPVDGSMTRREILSRTSGLYWSSNLASGDPLEERLFPVNQQAVRSVVEATDPRISRLAQDRLRYLPSYLVATVQDLAGEEHTAARAREIASRGLEEHRLGTEAVFRHEGVRTHGWAEMAAMDAMSRAVVGYTLHSRFWPTTDPVHASNDGMRFFSDNRPGSSLPWSQRLIPPYRKNCVCFTTPIVGFPEELTPIFNEVVPGEQGLEPRNPGTWADWYSQQSPEVKEIVGGTREFVPPTLSSILGPDGRFLPLPRVNPPDQASVLERKLRVQGNLTQQSWSELGLEPPNPEREEQNRRVIERLLA